MRNEIKFKRQADNFLVFVAAICIAGLIFVYMIEGYEAKLAEQEYLKNEIAADNDWLTRLNSDLENQIDLLEEYVKTQDIMIKKQQETIDRLMKLEAVEQVQAVTAAEARGEPLSGQCAVMQTMIDRSVAWNMTVKEVIEAPGQYAPPYHGKIGDGVKTAFDLVFLDGYRVFDGDTTHFHAKYIEPPHWTKSKINRGAIGVHKFYGTDGQ